MSARATCRCGWTRTYTSPARARANAARHVCRTADGVRRATRRFRCKRCGLEAVYDNAGAREARNWFNKHSCHKREDAMLRAAMRDAREALIDRTPQPCLHKYANHQHGERATYVLDKCRCLPCVDANRLAENERTRAKAYGRYNKHVPAEFVREHLRELGEYGIGLKRVAKLSGVSTGTLSKIMFGVYAPPEGEFRGCKGEGKRVREPSRRVLRSTAEKIYAVEPIFDNLADSAVIETPIGVPRRVQALIALGWSQSQLAARLGIRHRGNFHLHEHRWTITAGRVRQVHALYDQLSMTLPPETTWHQKSAANRSRGYAAVRGWAPPLAWDDDTIDDPAAEPNLTGDPDLEEAS